MATLQAFDLTRQAPRSPRARLGGFAILPRMLDKGRATIVHKSGEYNFDCPLDNQFLSYVGLKGSEILPQLEGGLTNWEMLEWILANARNKRTEAEILTWSSVQDNRGPGDIESQQYFTQTLAKLAPHRKDISTWFHLLDLDDYVSFGGRA